MRSIADEMKRDTIKIREEVKRRQETRKRGEAISYELLEICAKRGLTITEMTELSRIFPQLVKEKIKMIEQRTNFTVGHDQN